MGKKELHMLVFDSQVPILNRQTLQRETKKIFVSFSSFVGTSVGMPSTSKGKSRMVMISIVGSRKTKLSVIWHADI
jgi:hypothetical protein